MGALVRVIVGCSLCTALSDMPDLRGQVERNALRGVALRLFPATEAAMHGRSAVAGLAALLAMGGVAQSDFGSAVEAVFAPAYDSVTRSSLHNLALAMQSYAMFEDNLERVTVAELAEWGWTPSDTTAMTIWVHDGQFRIVAQDVRPGASVFAVGNTGEKVLTVECIALAPPAGDPVPEVGVTIQIG